MARSRYRSSGPILVRVRFLGVWPNNTLSWLFVSFDHQEVGVAKLGGEGNPGGSDAFVDPKAGEALHINPGVKRLSLLVWQRLFGAKADLRVITKWVPYLQQVIPRTISLRRDDDKFHKEDGDDMS